MNQYKLSDIATQIAVHSFLKEEWHDEIAQAKEYVYKTVDIIGTNNSALRNPLNLDEDVFYFRDREYPLTGQEMISGDYLLFKYIGHNGDMFINECISIDELEDEITGGGGITNTFTTFQIPIVMGKVRHYTITFINGIDGQEYNFVKGIHDALPEWDYENEQPGEVFFEISKVKIHWLNS
ncbi:hypothetical protein [Paenibacillus montanisoli]|uniref:Uncharacterized protein n=1 Tax=Paenibacillus montanisoli TaxID=2081970 RepID=A0A328U3G3_9BACL|nr:hypothetical protein [Paenibacillus montanisoli]RAP77189.1 hypothetical protein DL346_01425 [Paenibacillus montanisoli]